MWQNVHDTKSEILSNTVSVNRYFKMAATCAAAKQVPRCLQPVQPVQAVDCTLFRSLSLAVLLSDAVAHPVCHCWCDSSAVCHLRHRPRTANLQCFLHHFHLTLFTRAPLLASEYILRHSSHQSASPSCAIWLCSAVCTDTASAPRSAHHYHPLCPLPGCPRNFSDLHTGATDCSPRRNLLKAIRLHLFSTALRQAIGGNFPSAAPIHPS